MYVEDITIEGFKSYATRTVVPGFDPQFNAITGLNGSGKSNILDSICFVLGITNLSQVRAGNLQDLVYKQGQAGVTKATVSITFNNSDPERSPAGYEHCETLTVSRQIVIGGRNKYLINGHVAQPSRVQDLFHSVQLNVNNPHFLIMQGRIMKVLNMKPPEILSMLEEAAGTRMYETKRTNALKTMEKKQTKVEEINKVLEEEILPALEKLRKERGQYMQWVASSDQLDRLRRFCVAYEFAKAQDMQASSAGDQTALQEKMDGLKLKTSEMEASIGEVEGNMEALTKERDEQMGGELQKISTKVDDLSKSLVKATSAWNNKEDNLKESKQAVKKLQKTAAELEKQAESKAAEMDRINNDNAELQKSMDTATQNAAAAERNLADVLAGKGASDDGAEGKSFAEQLANLKNEASAAESEAKQAKLKAKHLEKELAAKRKLLATKDKESQKLDKDLAKERGAVEFAQEALGRLGFDKERARALEEARAAEQAAVRQGQEKVDVLSSGLSRMDFQYRDPERGFDRSKVKGVVAKLLRVKDPNTSTALEVLAGGKLYQVVVDDDVTSKALINRGQLRQRYTIIPLNRVNPRVANSKQLAAAKKIAGDNAALALSLVGYEDEVKKAMEYVFGSSFVCKDSKSADMVAFHNDVRMTCVTLAGDLFNPAGTLTGGARKQGNSVLTKLHALAEAEAELETHREALLAAERELASMQTLGKEFAKLQKEVELKTHSLALLEERVQKSEVHQLSEAVNAMEADLDAAQTTGQSSEERSARLTAKAAGLETEMREFTEQREARLGAAERAAKEAKAALAAAKEAAKDMATEVRDLAADREALLEERAATLEQVTAAELLVETVAGEVQELAGKMAAQKAEYDAAAAQLADRRARAQECDKEIATLGKQKASLGKKLTDANVEARKLEHKLGRMEKEAQEAAQRVHKLQADYPWIASEQQLFGQAGGDYDWNTRSPQEAMAELEELAEVHEKMSKKVNKKVLSMFDKAEQEYQELVDKRTIVLKDKQKIRQVIGELDEKKALALKATWEKVNKDFGSIFSTLLPGTMAKLEPPEGGDVLDGLEVRVQFGSVWKESLTELSGGQRSLLALSLILALLLFKPAPIYILDEVDAALDLSHTQNIGRMIKTHFPQSQFIVVSLKEGMFNNANLIFRTKFVDGVSTVTRTVPSLKDRPQEALNTNKQKAAGADATKRRRKDALSKENQAPAA